MQHFERRRSSCSWAWRNTGLSVKQGVLQAHTSFSNELKIYRIEQGCLLLESTNMAISDIADQLGFHDVASFRRMFKKEVGQAPTEYRMARSSG